MWRRALDRPAQLVVVVMTVACVVSLALVGGLVWRDHARLHRIRERVEFSSRVQALGTRLQRALLAAPESSPTIDAETLARVVREVEEIRSSDRTLHPLSEGRLARLAELLTSSHGDQRATILAAVAVVNDVVAAETEATAAAWQRIHADASREVWLVAGLVVVLPACALLTVWLIRRRLLAPLVDLRRLLGRLAEGDLTPAESGVVHPAVRPLFDSYGQLVGRLVDLEAEHAARAATLEDEVRAATEALLEQQGSLARAERLAAVGETSASLAHELRNPLAGIAMTLANLRHDVDDEDVAARVGLVASEIERMTRLLDQALSAARHTPEPSRRVDLGDLVADLLSLLRYQIAPQIRLEADVPRGLWCEVPRDRLRQALLNLVLNSAHAVGEREGEITIRARQRRNTLEILVEDDGPGFPDGLLRAPVRAFVSPSGDGTGLGLAMVRRLTADLGGRLELANRERRGAVVRLYLPWNDG